MDRILPYFCESRVAFSPFGFRKGSTTGAAALTAIAVYCAIIQRVTARTGTSFCEFAWRSNAVCKSREWQRTSFAVCPSYTEFVCRQQFLVRPRPAKSTWLGIACTKPYAAKSSSNSLTHGAFLSQFAESYVLTFTEFFAQFHRQRRIEFSFMGRTRDRQFAASI